MKQTHQFNNYFQAWKNCFESMKQSKIFLLFISYAVIQIGFIFILMYYAYPPFSAMLIPIIKKTFGDVALHYPNNFLILPTLFNWVNILLSGFLGIVLVAASTDLFSKCYFKKSINFIDGLKRILPNYSILFVVWLIETAILLIVFLGVPSVLNNLEFFSNRGNLLIQLITSVIAVGVGAFFIYTTALIVLDNTGPIKSITRSLSLFVKYPLVSILLIGIPNFIRMPIDLLSGKSQFLISKFTPEMVSVVLILSILISIFTNYLLIGTVTKYFLLVKESKY